MLEEIKNKARQMDSKKTDKRYLQPEVGSKLKKRGLDPETVTLEHLFPEGLDEDGNYLSLMPAAEMLRSFFTSSSDNIRVFMDNTNLKTPFIL